jgi:hypothetical protein
MDVIFMSEDQTSDKALLGYESEEIEQARNAAKNAFTRPEYQFKGAELLPFTYGYELLFNQVRDAEDTGLFTWFAFVFLLSKRNGENTDEHRKWAIGIAWKVAAFREELTKWMDDNGPFTNEDKIEAKRIYEESMKALTETAIEPVPSKGSRGSQKKTRQVKQPSSSIS